MTGPQTVNAVEEVALEHGALTFTTRGLVCRCGEKFLSVAEYNQHVIRAVLAPTQSRPTVDEVARVVADADMWWKSRATTERGNWDVHIATAVLALIPTVSVEGGAE